jgi:hypothetical protein
MWLSFLGRAWGYQLVRGPHATLLLPGAAGELAAAKRSIPQALAELACFLRSENLTVVGVEYEFPAPDTELWRKVGDDGVRKAA